MNASVHVFILTERYLIVQYCVWFLVPETSYAETVNNCIHRLEKDSIFFRIISVASIITSITNFLSAEKGHASGKTSRIAKFMD